jgi:hypothetical protein
MKLKKKKLKWTLALKSKVKFWNKKSRPLKEFFLKKAKRIFTKKKKNILLRLFTKAWPDHTKQK